MGDPLDSEPQRLPSWKALQKRIHWWLVVQFGLNSTRDKDIWLFCIGAAMNLERLAMGVLWIDDERPGLWPEYEAKKTLGWAHGEIARRGLFDEATRSVLKAVADLRNSVAHRHAIFVTIPTLTPGHPIGEYKGRPVFHDREALAELMRDKDAVSRVMYEWMIARAPDLAEEARRSGAHPTPPSQSP